MKNRNLPSRDDWQTPRWFYEKLNQDFDFTFDPCPYVPDGGALPFDGLSIDWGERNFINPPYSRKLKEAFVHKAIEESKRGKLCVMLLPVSTSTRLFHEVILPANPQIKFVRGRLSFVGVNTKGEETSTGKPMHDSMIVIFDGREISTNA